MPELKPCPFCGSMPTICVDNHDVYMPTYYVVCTYPNHELDKRNDRYISETEAIAAWNKRVKEGEE